MDLIDAEEVISVIEITARYHVNYFGELAKGAGRYGPALYKAEDIYKAINGVPVVDAIPVKHGKWLDYLKEGLQYRCSECGSRFDRPYNYCPNCGTRMDVEQEKRDENENRR